jgi:hypothetical protein
MLPCADTIGTIKKTQKRLIEASKEVGLEVNTEKTKCMLSHHQNARKNYDMEVGNRSVENVA